MRSCMRACVTFLAPTRGHGFLKERLKRSGSAFSVCGLSGGLGMSQLSRARFMQRRELPYLDAEACGLAR